VKELAGGELEGGKSDHLDEKSRTKKKKPKSLRKEHFHPHSKQKDTETFPRLGKKAGPGATGAGHPLTEEKELGGRDGYRPFKNTTGTQDF